MEEGDVPSALVDSLHPFESNNSTSELGSAISHLHLEGEKRTSSHSMEENQITRPSVHRMQRCWTVIIQPLFLHSRTKKTLSLQIPILWRWICIRPLPSPQVAPPQAIATPLPHGPVLIYRVCYQTVPAPHNVVVAQSAVPAPSIVPCSSAMATVQPAASQASIATLVSPTTTTASSKSNLSVTFSPASQTKPRVRLEFAMPKSLPPIKRPSKETRRSRHRSRSSSRTPSRSVSHQRNESGNINEPGSQALKRCRGRGR